MFSNSSKQSRIDTLIGEGTTVEGDISFAGCLRIDGGMIGNLRGDHSTCTLVIGKQGSLKGSISVAHFVIDGSAEGDVRVENNLEMQSNGKIKGDIYYKNLEVQLGAVIDGQIMQGNQLEFASSAD